MGHGLPEDFPEKIPLTQRHQKGDFSITLVPHGTAMAATGTSKAIGGNAPVASPSSLAPQHRDH